MWWCLLKEFKHDRSATQALNNVISIFINSLLFYCTTGTTLVEEHQRGDPQRNSLSYQ